MGKVYPRPFDKSFDRLGTSGLRVLNTFVVGLSNH